MKQDFYQKLTGILSEEKIRRDEPMKTHTTFRVGGPADYFVMPETALPDGRGALLRDRKREQPSGVG